MKGAPCSKLAFCSRLAGHLHHLAHTVRGGPTGLTSGLGPGCCGLFVPGLQKGLVKHQLWSDGASWQGGLETENSHVYEGAGFFVASGSNQWEAAGKPLPGAA